jgi:hypothetical protein
MAMFTAYFDASGHPAQGAVLSVAGFVAHIDQWIHFEKNWKAALDAYGVSQLHMKDFGPGAGEFASWKNDKHKRQVFIERLINIIKTRCRRSFVNSIMLEHYRKVDQIYTLTEMNRPLALAGDNCIQKVKDWAKDRNINENEIAIIFEDGDKDKGDLMRCCERDHGFVPNFMKKHQSCAFQAADLLAYEHRLANKKIYDSGVGTLEMSDLRGSLQALDEVPPGAEEWGVYDQDSLTAFCIGNKLPLRSTFAAHGP